MLLPHPHNSHSLLFAGANGQTGNRANGCRDAHTCVVQRATASIPKHHVACVRIRGPPATCSGGMYTCGRARTNWDSNRFTRRTSHVETSASNSWVHQTIPDMLRTRETTQPDKFWLNAPVCWNIPPMDNHTRRVPVSIIFVGIRSREEAVQACHVGDAWPIHLADRIVPAACRQLLPIHTAHRTCCETGSKHHVMWQSDRIEL